MEKYTKYAQTLDIYAEFFDNIGDYDSANECVSILQKLAEVQETEIRTASTREANFFKSLERGFRKNVVNPIKNLGNKVDQAVRKYIPGGWLGAVAMAGAAGAFGPGKLNIKFLNDFFGKGGTISNLLTSDKPYEKMMGENLLKFTQTNMNLGTPGGVQTKGPLPPSGQSASFSTSLYSEVNKLQSDIISELNKLVDINQRKTKFNAESMPKIEALFSKYKNVPNADATKLQMIASIKRQLQIQ